MYLNGEKIVDNDGCHGERERHSHHKSLSVGAHHVVLDMCEMGGGQNFKFHYQGPDTGVAKVKVPSSVLRHEAKAQWGAMLTTFSLVTRSWIPKKATAIPRELGCKKRPIHS